MPYEAIKAIGLGPFLSVAIMAMAWFILKKTFDNHDKDREIWTGTMQKNFENLNRASDYQRKEHETLINTGEEILKGLRGLNGNSRR